MEQILEILMEAAMDLPKKKWVKTMLFVMVTQLFTAFCAWIMVTSPIQAPNSLVDIISWIVLFVWSFGMLALAVIGHKHNWKR